MLHHFPRRAPGAIWLAAACALLAAGLMFLDTGAKRAARAATSAEPMPPLVLTPGSPTRPISLRDRLIAGLLARRGSEIEFIDRVVIQVRLGKLPERLVNQTFFWARDRARRTGYPTAGTQRPIIYFQPVMTAQAKRLGVSL